MMLTNKELELLILKKTMSINNKFGSISVGSTVRINLPNALHMKLVQIP